jgi:hypothetical protein
MRQVNLLLIRAALAAAAATLVAAIPAQAADNSFDGSCDGQGTATLDKPVTATPQDNVIHARGTGTCYGTLNGVPVGNAPVETATDAPFYGSCYSNHTTTPGPSYLRFTRATADPADDVVLRSR